ncbi:cytochrome P450 [Punctularia strigosozonata HHB-11173 SS5]|uniref:Cytochrome P450 n=1 Tax=Punctularia strigosozonata (strain HHB-11173) TaxID=741275 RepID=R7S199_PUNST|nr:cytochrome P450 [Punctularia strigosozonata HHB-11173 SS5]EIN04150.1 cytochrome P450 [Punctularia strigosozonata HHB-11173 SS5]
MLSASNALLLFAAAYVLGRIYAIWKILQSVKGVPVQFVLIQPLTSLAILLPHGRWNPGTHYVWDARSTAYSERRFEAIHFVPLLYGSGYLYNVSPEAYKQIMSQDGMDIQKPVEGLTLDFLGSNVVASNGDMWKRHRKIAAPAFNQETYADVWEVTARLYHEMLQSEAWKAGDSITFPAFNHFTTRIALLVIAACGFDMRIGWDESPSYPGLHSTIDRMIVTVSSNLLFRILAPAWILSIPSAIMRRIKISYEDLQRYLHAEISNKRADLRKRKAVGGATETTDRNVFGRLVTASESEGSRGLDLSELTGNLFIFLFAGHETTAHTLVVTLALLAVHMEEQENICRHIQETIGNRDPTFQDYSALGPVLHAFYEASRLYPAGYVQIREPQSNIVLKFHDTERPDAQRDVFVAKGILLCMDQVGLNRNPRTFPQPEDFIPSRWRDKSADDLVAFSFGPRVCLGKKFAFVEAACFLTHLLRDWKIELDLTGYSSFEEWQAKYMYPLMGITLKTGDVPLRVVKRPS